MLVHITPTLKVAAVSGLLAVSVLAAGCGTRVYTGAHAAKRTTNSSASRMTTTITFGKKGDSFGPPGPGEVRPALTAQQAWTKFAHPGSDNSPIPSGTTVRLGLLTVIVGPVGSHGKVGYRVRGKLVYGYRYHQCPKSQAPGGTVPPNPCLAWAFLNADNGNFILQTYQTY